MGLDLYLLPFSSPPGTGLAFSHNVLDCGRDYEFFDALQHLPQTPVPRDFTSYLSRDDKYEESHYGSTLDTPYGEVLTYTLAGEIKPLTSDNPRNGPVLAFIRALPDSTRVALYWH